MTLLASVVVLALLGVLVASIAHVSQSTRCRQLRHLAQQEALEFRRLAALDKDVRHARFTLFDHSEVAHAENQLQGNWRRHPFKSFDYSYLDATGPRVQSIVILQCPMTSAGEVSIAHQSPSGQDAFTELTPQHTRLRSLHNSLLPTALANCRVHAANPVALQTLLDSGLGNWLEQHPDVDIEHRQNLLMVYRTGYVLPPEALLAALDSLAELAEVLDT